MHHLVLEDEAAEELEALTFRMVAETGAVSELEARIARRLAIAFWKGERAERMEVALLAAAPTTRMNGYRPEDADPLTTFDLRRFNAIRGQQGQIGREISRCLKELRLLRKDALAQDMDSPRTSSRTSEITRTNCCRGTDEPEPLWENEPGSPPPPANDDAAEASEPPATGLDAEVRNEPDGPAAATRVGPARPPAPRWDTGPELLESIGPDGTWLVEGVPLLDGWGRPRRHPLARRPAALG